MEEKRFSVEHIAGILKQAELGASIAELCGSTRSPSRAFTVGRISTGTWSARRQRNCGGCGMRTRSSSASLRISLWTKQCCRTCCKTILKPVRKREVVKSLRADRSREVPEGRYLVSVEKACRCVGCCVLTAPRCSGTFQRKSIRTVLEETSRAVFARW